MLLENFIRPPEYCILRDNVKLRQILKIKTKEYGFNKVCRDANVDVRNYAKFLKGMTKEVNQMAIIRVCNVLGVKIYFDVEV